MEPFIPTCFDKSARCLARIRSEGRPREAWSVSREGYRTKAAGACAPPRRGSVCITRQCQVVSKRNRECTRHLAPCPTGLRPAVDAYLALKVSSASNPGCEPGGSCGRLEKARLRYRGKAVQRGWHLWLCRLETLTNETGGRDECGPVPFERSRCVFGAQSGCNARWTYLGKAPSFRARSFVRLWLGAVPPLLG